MSPDFLHEGNKFLDSLSPVKFNFEDGEGIRVDQGFWQAGAHMASDGASLSSLDRPCKSKHQKRSSSVPSRQITGEKEIFLGLLRFV